MATVRTSDLLSKLVANAQTALNKADANRSGIISASEVRSVPSTLSAEFASYQRQVSSVRVTDFVSAFSAYAKGQLTRADANRDGSLSSTELAAISGMLKDNVLDILGTVTSTPVTPTPVTPVTPSPVTPTPSGTGVFGISGTIPASRVKLVPLLTQGLNKPTAMAFDHKGALWIVNEGDDSSIIVDNPGTRSQKAQKFHDDSAHFMNNPMAIAFSRGKDEFATVQDTTNDYNGMHMGNMFMGPTLWSANRGTFEGGTNSHIDMLHHSPNSVGIAAGLRPSGNDKREYWVFDGNTGSVDRYFFNKPHELGGDNHLDGETYRYATGQLRMVPNVPGHMDIDSKGTLFIADTGNGRIATFDTTRATTSGQRINAYHDETPLVGAQGPSVQTFASGLNAPSGLILKGGNVIVGEYGTGHIKVFGSDGKLKGDLDTGMGARALTGLCESKNGTIYALNQRSGQLVEVQIG